MALLVVLVDKDPQAELMHMDIAATRARFAHQVGETLPQGGVEALNVRRFARLLTNRTMAFGRDDRGIGRPKIGVPDGPLAVVGRQ